MLNYGVVHLDLLLSRHSLEFKVTICKIDSWWEFLYDAGSSKPVLCDNLEGWDGVGGGREVQGE